MCDCFSLTSVPTKTQRKLKNIENASKLEFYSDYFSNMQITNCEKALLS